MKCKLQSRMCMCRSSSENSMVVVRKDPKEVGRTQQAHNKMAEELSRVNSDLAVALKGLQEVSL